MSGDRIAADPTYGAAAMPAEDADPLLAQMRNAVRSGGGRRSRLSVWMAEREAEIAGMIAAYGADWETWARLWVVSGLLGAPKDWGVEGPAGAAARRRAAETARQTWLRVRRRRRAVQGTARPKAAAPQAGASPAGDGGSHGMQGLLSRDEEAARRRLAALDREMRERSR